MTHRTSLLVRRATLDDVPRLATINVDSWRDGYSGLVASEYLDALDLDQYAERWRERLTNPSGERVCLVAEVDLTVASYAVGGAYRTQQDAPPGEDTTGWGELAALYTHPSMQGRGAGVAVHDALLAELTRRGFVRAGLWVLQDNVRAIRWYGRRDWRPDGAVSIWAGSGQQLREIRLVQDLPRAPTRH